jgi:DNA mismatch repair protein MutL
MSMLYMLLRSSIKHSLGQFNAPVLDFDRDSNLDTPYNYKNLKGNSYNSG